MPAAIEILQAKHQAVADGIRDNPRLPAGGRFFDFGTRPVKVPGLRESNAATGSGLSGRSRKVEFAGTAKSAWKSKRRNASTVSPKASSVKTEKTFGAPAGGGVRPLKSDGIMPEEALLRIRAPR